MLVSDRRCLARVMFHLRVKMLPNAFKEINLKLGLDFDGLLYVMHLDFNNFPFISQRR